MIYVYVRSTEPVFLGYVKFVKINLFIFNVLLSDLECFNLVRSVNSFSYNTNHKCSSIVISGGFFFFFFNFIEIWTYRNVHANLKCDEVLQS